MDLGEEELRKLLSEFSCEKNPDVERFFKEQSIDFTKKNQSVTYLVFESENAALVGYFTLGIKPISVNEKISGEQLLQAAVETIKELQYMAGGMVVFLEAEDEPKLMNFYEKENGFKRFDTREVKAESDNAHTLIQLLKVL
jgi:hypothetical protein